MNLKKINIFRIVLIIMILLITNFLTYNVSKHFTTLWYEKLIIQNNLQPSGQYHLRTDKFENVLYIYNIFDTSYYHYKSHRLAKLTPCVAKKYNNKMIFEDISKDYDHRGEKYYSQIFESNTINDGDTLWIDGDISEYPDSISKLYPVSLNRLYQQPKSTTWSKVFFKDKMEDPPKK